MNIIAVDDERRALNTLVKAVKTARPEADVTGFTSAKEALEFAKENRVDAAFLDVQMAEMNGLFLAKALKDVYGKTNIIFVTAYSQYAGDAIALRASGYVMKPINPDHVREEIENLRNPVSFAPDSDTCLRVQTFGNFEVFLGGKPLRFPRSKSKEVLAYLVHKNGTSCSMRELSAVLFEDNAKMDSMRVYVSVMIKTLEEAGAEGVVIKRYNSVAVDTSKFDCDLYRFMKMDSEAVNAYAGEYMANYSWAEFMTGYLDKKALL